MSKLTSKSELNKGSGDRVDRELKVDESLGGMKGSDVECIGVVSVTKLDPGILLSFFGILANVM